MGKLSFGAPGMKILIIIFYIIFNTSLLYDYFRYNIINAWYNKGTLLASSMKVNSKYTVWLKCNFFVWEKLILK